MQARFWIWKNDGWVKIKLNPDQSVTHYKGWRHEEGWSCEEETFWFDGGIVYSRVYQGGRDCDGPQSGTYLHHCTVGMLNAVQTDDGVLRPAWVKGPTSFYDAFAEASGY